MMTHLKQKQWKKKCISFASCKIAVTILKKKNVCTIEEQLAIMQATKFILSILSRVNVDDNRIVYIKKVCKLRYFLHDREAIEKVLQTSRISYSSCFFFRWIYTDEFFISTSSILWRQDSGRCVINLIFIWFLRYFYSSSFHRLRRKKNSTITEDPTQPLLPRGVSVYFVGIVSRLVPHSFSVFTTYSSVSLLSLHFPRTDEKIDNILSVSMM